MKRENLRMQARAQVTPLFRPDLLSIRRKMKQLSQIELAERAGITQGTISKVEQGLREPSEDFLGSVAQALDCPVSFFFRPGREYGLPISAHPMFRKKASVGQKILDQVIAELNVRIGHVPALLSSVDFEPELKLPQYDLDDYDGDAEQIAENIRRAWYVPNGPLKGLTDYVERAGCLVIECDMAAAKIDGVSYRIPGMPPMIFLNKHQPADRLRFTLAHELGHLILHTFPSPNMEVEANEFASALLMPRADIGPELSGLSIEKAAYMKPQWQVSMAALIVRAVSLQKIDASKASYMWRQMAIKGFRTREPSALDFPRETPTVISALLSNLIEELRYEEADLESALHLYYGELSQMYDLAAKPAGLRLVK